MSKRKITGRRKQYEAQDESNRLPATWWIVGSVVAIGVIASVIWLVTAPDQERADHPTPENPTAQPTAMASTDQPSDQEDNGMPSTPSDRANMYDAPPEMEIDPSASYQATITTAKGDIVVDLNAEAAPQTVNNFVFLAREGFYDGLTFHRVEPGFVIQGGDPLGTGRGGPGYTVPAEIGLPHVEGALAMARRSNQVNPERASSGSQFYITLAETPFLDGEYTVFGEVVEGMDIVQSIAVGDEIESITITEQ